jgi:hypothetical protein
MTLWVFNYEILLRPKSLRPLKFPLFSNNVSYLLTVQWRGMVGSTQGYKNELLRH